MDSSEENIAKNVACYDQFYAKVNVDNLVAKVRNLKNFLEEAIRTDTGWHGFYHGGFLDRIANKRILELGCGDGLNALVMASLGADVVANDISHETERILKEATSRLGIVNLQVCVGNFSVLPFEERSFDFVVGKAFLHHLTHELEEDYISKAADLLKASGEARFQEPAVNSLFLDKVRWLIPVPERPSILCRKRFLKWKENDAHPERDNSSNHYLQLGRKFFFDAAIVPFGSIERFCRLMPSGNFNRRFRRWAHRADERLPMSFRYRLARAQVISFRHPRHNHGSAA